MNSHAVEVAFLASLSWIAWAAAFAAIEVERLGEGQRFTTKLLTERAAQSLIVPPQREEYRRVDTPH